MFMVASIFSTSSTSSAAPALLLLLFFIRASSFVFGGIPIPCPRRNGAAAEWARIHGVFPGAPFKSRITARARLLLPAAIQRSYQ